MADNPKKVGVYDTGTTTGGTTDAGPKPKVEVQRTAGRSGTSWWVIGLILLAIIIALVILT